jgi:hypothetical protein
MDVLLDDDVEQEDADVGRQGGSVVHQDHDADAESRAEEGQPPVVVLERRPPT